MVVVAWYKLSTVYRRAMALSNIPSRAESFYYRESLYSRGQQILPEKQSQRNPDNPIRCGQTSPDKQNLSFKEHIA